MLDVKCTEHLENTRAFADRIGKREQLEEKLKYLENYACHGDEKRTITELYDDGTPYGFYFVIQKRRDDNTYHPWFNGGLIFHGPHDGGGDGGAPTYSVSLAGTKEQRWEIHT